MCEDLPLLACRASSNILFDPWAHVRPPEESFGFADRLVSAWVSRGVTIVDVRHELPSEALVGWYNQFVVLQPRPLVITFPWGCDIVFELPFIQGLLVLSLDPGNGSIPIVELSIYVRYSYVHRFGNGSVSSKIVGYDVLRVDELVVREDGYLRVISGSLIVVRVSGQEVGG